MTISYSLPVVLITCKKCGMENSKWFHSYILNKICMEVNKFSLFMLQCNGHAVGFEVLPGTNESWWD